MHLTILLPLLLAISERTYNISLPYPFDDATTYDQNFRESVKDSNKMMKKMEKIIKNADNPKNVEMLETAFGPKWRDHHDQLKQDIHKMRHANLQVHDRNPHNSEAAIKDGAFPAMVIFPKKGAGNVPTAYFGTDWHNENRVNRAGTLIHELSHAQLGTGDHIVANSPGPVKFISSREAYARENKIPPQDVRRGKGYIDGTTEDVINNGKSALGPSFQTYVTVASNPHRNADSWKVLAALGKKDQDERRDRQKANIERKQAKLNAQSGGTCPFSVTRAKAASKQGKESKQLSKSADGSKSGLKSSKETQKSTKSSQKSRPTTKSSLDAKTRKPNSKTTSNAKAAKGASKATAKGKASMEKGTTRSKGGASTKDRAIKKPVRPFFSEVFAFLFLDFAEVTLFFTPTLVLDAALPLVRALEPFAVLAFVDLVLDA
ncbi:15244_t:CDS:2, partial [Acaulospora colombiana]